MIADRSHIATEQSNPASENLDQLSIPDAIALMQREDQRALDAVVKAQSQIATLIAKVTHSFQIGGRLLYIGAGTSGRLGVLDASECPPTFFSDPNMVIGIIAGGDAALKKSIENVEDDREAGRREIASRDVGSHDVVVGIAAGGTTPYVHAALEEAHGRGAYTAFVICTDEGHVRPFLPVGVPDLYIALDTGPEVLTGSTRLKAGTATKLVLNTLTTLAMVQIGKTFGNQMVDVDALKNAKLVDRGCRIISGIAGCSREEALPLLEAAGGKVKRAIVMRVRGVGVGEADRLLEGSQGRLRGVIG